VALQAATCHRVADEHGRLGRFDPIRDHSRTLDAHDNWVTTEDPGFVDAAAGDFRLKEHAPLFARIPQFEPIHLDRMGLRKEPTLTRIDRHRHVPTGLDQK